MVKVCNLAKDFDFGRNVNIPAYGGGFIGPANRGEEPVGGTRAERDGITPGEGPRVLVEVQGNRPKDGKDSGELRLCTEERRSWR
jgi:hypothetical protein